MGEEIHVNGLGEVCLGLLSDPQSTSIHPQNWDLPHASIRVGLLTSSPSLAASFQRSG